MAKPLAKLFSMLTPKRRWAQFSLATMLVVVTVLCVWLAVVVNRANRQREIIEFIRARGGYAVSDAQLPSPPLPHWRQALLGLFGDDYVARVVRVALPPDRDAFKRKDSGIFVGQRLEPAANGCAIDDDGLRIIADLEYLEDLDLSWTQIGDRGLTHLQGMRSLRFLSLCRTEVTDAGVAELQEALPNCRIIQ